MSPGSEVKETISTGLVPEKKKSLFYKYMERAEKEKEDLIGLFKKHSSDLEARRRGTLCWYIRRLDLLNRFMREAGITTKKTEAINLGSGVDTFFWPSGINITHVDSSEHIKKIVEKGGKKAAEESSPHFVETIAPKNLANFLGISLEELKTLLSFSTGKITLSKALQKKSNDRIEGFLTKEDRSIRLIRKDIEKIDDKDLTGKEIAIMKGNIRNYAFGGDNYEPGKDPTQYLNFIEKLKNAGIKVILSESKNTKWPYLIENEKIDRLLKEKRFEKLEIPPRLASIFDFSPMTREEAMARRDLMFGIRYNGIEKVAYGVHTSMGSLEPASNVHTFIPSIFISKDHPRLEEIKNMIENIGNNLRE